jgi:hypothetical protein
MTHDFCYAFRSVGELKTLRQMNIPFKFSKGDAEPFLTKNQISSLYFIVSAKCREL